MEDYFAKRLLCLVVREDCFAKRLLCFVVMEYCFAKRLFYLVVIEDCFAKSFFGLTISFHIENKRKYRFLCLRPSIADGENHDDMQQCRCYTKINSVKIAYFAL
ncbi:MAG: hypothetical protein LBV32_00065 [Tannerellaceae bacterium]|nr:hypothetical protein [Tannerellaceae bacterium]